MRLAARGYDVIVYCRARYSQPTYRGVSLVYLPAWRHKYFETIVHTFLCTIHLLFHRPRVALYCNGANAIFTLLPRLAGVPVGLNVDGLERKRKKWNRLAKAWYLASERLATILPSAVITDAAHIRDYYLQRYSKRTTFIPYGAAIGKVETTVTLSRLGLEKNEYFLYVSRMEPENNALLVREAFERTETSLKLALIGDAPYAREYLERVRATRDPRIIMPGAIYGQGYHELGSHCFAYIHATEVGGTHPALIEAMGRGALVLYLDTPENAEVAEGAGIPFTPAELARTFRLALEMGAAEQDELRRAAMSRVAERYSWNAVADRYESLLTNL